jgi:hypothetical protein
MRALSGRQRIQSGLLGKAGAHVQASHVTSIMPLSLSPSLSYRTFPTDFVFRFPTRLIRILTFTWQGPFDAGVG